MSEAVRIDVEGDTELRVSLARVSAALDHLDAAETKTGQYIRTRAASLAPKRSGALAQSIRADTAGEGVSVGSDLVYAPVQEYGSANLNIAAQPFLRPAADDTGVWVEFYADDVQRLLDTVKGA